MPIKTLQPSSYDAWNDFVERQCLEATFCHMAQWQTVMEKVFKHRSYFLYLEQDGAIAAVLPMALVQSRLFGNALVSTPFCVYGGCAAVDEQSRQTLQDHARDLAGTLAVDYLELRYQNRTNADWPCKDSLYVTFRKAIDEDVEQNMKNIPRKQRAMVRKGIQAGLRCEQDQDVNRFFDVYASSVHGMGTPVFSKKYFQVLQEVFGRQCEMSIAHKDGDVNAAVMSFYFRDQVLPYYGGGYAVARKNKAFDFMYWDLMRRSCEKGITWYDYGRSKVGTGSYSFKKNWGFEPQPLHYEFQLIKSKSIPDINPLNPKYQMFIAAWKRLPLAVTKVLGPHIVRNLG